MNDHVMFDIETLGTSARAPVLSAGVLFFNPKTGAIGDKELFLFNPNQQPDRPIDYDTMIWWMDQKAAAQAHWRRAVFPDIQEELLRFLDFVRDYQRTIWWACGPQFDMVIMETLLADNNWEVPWIHWNVRDVRTVRDHINRRDVKANTNAHNPVEDCVTQAAQVIEFYKLIRSQLPIAT